MQATRQEILDFLRQHGEGSVRELGAHLSLTPTGVRQHLAILEREGLVANRELRGQVGRPALAFRLTPQAEQLYPKAYDELANAVLGAARSLLPAETYGSLVANAAEILAAPHLAALAALNPVERVRATCALLEQRAVVVNWEPDGAGGFMLFERTCPSRDVAAEHPALCPMDAALIGRLTGMHAELRSSLAAGAERCAYHLTPVPAPVPRRLT